MINIDTYTDTHSWTEPAPPELPTVCIYFEYFSRHTESTKLTAANCIHPISSNHDELRRYIFLTVWAFGANRVVNSSGLLFIGLGEMYPPATPKPLLSKGSMTLGKFAFKKKKGSPSEKHLQL